MGCHFLLQGIFPTQGSNPGLLHLPALAHGFFTTSPSWETCYSIIVFTILCLSLYSRVPRDQNIVGCSTTEYSLEGLMLKLKFQYFGHLMWRANSLGKTLMLGKTEGRRRGDDRGWSYFGIHTSSASFATDNFLQIWGIAILPAFGLFFFFMVNAGKFYN